MRGGRFALLLLPAALAATLWIAGRHPVAAVDAGTPESPELRLPPHVEQLTHFGERADWARDGSRLLFLARALGDVYEYELATDAIRPVTHHFPHAGFTRAHYLANGDILLSGPPPSRSRGSEPSRKPQAELWVLDKSISKPPARLREQSSAGLAVSRARMRIAWTVTHGDAPERVPEGASQIWMAEIDTSGGTARLAGKRMLLDSRELPFPAGVEAAEFRPRDEKELIFSALGYQGTEVCGVDLETKRITNYSNAPEQYDAAEGIFPDGEWTSLQSDRHNRRGAPQSDIWRLRLNGSGYMERLTHFSDTEGYRASDAVVSDDGRWMAFQIARVGDPAGSGRGLFLLDLSRAPRQMDIRPPGRF